MKIAVIWMVMLYGVLAGVSTAGGLTDNGDGTVTDGGTLLIWQQGESSTMTWEEALAYCEGLVLPASGNIDWRLPNHKELLSLVDDARSNPTINTTKFPNAISLIYWSSTTGALATHAWGVNFNAGYSYGYDKTSTGYSYARCVRGGQ